MPTIAVYPMQVNDPAFAQNMGYKNYANVLIIGVTDIVSPKGRFYKATVGGGLDENRAWTSYAKKWEARLKRAGWNIVRSANEMDALQKIAIPQMGFVQPLPHQAKHGMHQAYQRVPQDNPAWYPGPENPQYIPGPEMPSTVRDGGRVVQYI